MSWNGTPVPEGFPIPRTGKRNYRKVHERKSRMMQASQWTMPPTWRCCPTHDRVWMDRGALRRKERAQWLSEVMEELF